jgi:large subunit ribosomal protein L23
MKLTKAILNRIVTEKSLKEEENGKYTFAIALAASAGLIKSELKKMYDVDVVNIRTVILPGKPKRKGGTNQFKKTAQRKKAIVELKEGQKIEVEKEAKSK